MWFSQRRKPSIESTLYYLHTLPLNLSPLTPSRAANSARTPPKRTRGVRALFALTELLGGPGARRGGAGLRAERARQ